MADDLLGDVAPKVATRPMKLDAINREIKWRERVYPGRVQQGKMSKEAADFQIWIMREIAKDYAP